MCLVGWVPTGVKVVSKLAVSSEICCFIFMVSASCDYVRLNADSLNFPI